MKNTFKILMAAAGIVVAGQAVAADMAVKAINNALTTAYPYQSSGLFFGAFTEGAGGSVAATVPGVGASSLTTTTGAIGGTVGYAWGRKGSAIAYSLEGDFAFTNFNGNNTGLAIQGPLMFEQRFVVFAPWANIMNALPNNPFAGFFGGTVPPFPGLAPGVTASNLQMGIAAGVREKDISASFAGLNANKVWRVEPVIKLIAMEQLSNGTAVRAWVGVALPDKGKVFGPVGSSVTLGPEILAGVGAYF
jgi:hypothetical protein